MRQTEMEDLWQKAPKDVVMRQRQRHVVDFIDDYKDPFLDIGRDNPMKRFLEARLGINIESTEGNLDFGFITSSRNFDYGTIFCFEVLEHLANPLYLLDEMRKMVEKYDGIIYVSYPSMPQFLWNYNHYNEIADKRFRWLLEEAGLRIVKYQRKPLFGKWYTYLYGIRPFLRLFYCRRWNLYKLKVNGYEAF